VWRWGTVESGGRQPRSAAPASAQADATATPDTGGLSARPAGGLRLATLLLLFGASLVVPTLVATGLLLVREARTQSEQLDRRVEQVAGDLADDIDRQLDLMMATLTVFAGSPQLAGGELQAFHERATAALHPLGLELLYRDLDGQQLLNTRVPWGTPLPRRQLPEIDDAVRATLKPHFSDVLVGAVAGRPVVTLTVPVLIGGTLRGFLHMSINSERLLALMKGQQLPPEWNTGLSDRNGVIIARLLRHDDFVGTKLPEELRMQSRQEAGAFRTTNIEGVETIRAATVSPKTGWLVSANVPASVARATFVANLWSMAGVAIALALLALGLALLVARLIARPIQAIAGFAVMVENERIPPPLHSPVREANEVAAALRLASERLQDRSRALRQTLDRFNIALRGADIIVFVQDTERRFIWISDSDDAFRRDLMGHREEDALPPESHDAAIMLRQRALSTGQPQEGEVPMGTGNDARFFRVRVEPMYDQEGEMVGLLGVSAEITALKREQQRNTVLVRELAHRSKNLLAVVQAIAHETLRAAQGMDKGAAPKSQDDFMERFGARLSALARLQDLVVSGARGGVELRELVTSQLAPFAEPGPRLEIDGPSLRLRPEAANALGMALHELATNAAKYGCLSGAAGAVSVAWRFDPDADGTRRFRLSWREHGGPPVVSPARRGFGSSVVVDMAAATLMARVSLDYPTEGAHWQVDAPATNVVE
jgi:two-component sensor histidine kinase